MELQCGPDRDQSQRGPDFFMLRSVRTLDSIRAHSDKDRPPGLGSSLLIQAFRMTAERDLQLGT